MRGKAVAKEHLRFVDRLAGFIICFPSRISKAALLGFVLHRTVAWRMDVDRGVFIAPSTGGSRKDEIRKSLRCTKLTDNLHVVKSGFELRSIRKGQRSHHVGWHRRVIPNLPCGSRTESEGDEE